MQRLNDEDLRSLARRLQAMVQLGLDQKGGLLERWRRNEELYDNAAPPPEDEDSKLVRLHVNFLQPRIDMLTAMVAGVVGRQEPYMIARDLRDGQRSDRLERALQFFWQRPPASFENRLRPASVVAANTNKAVWKLSFRPFDPSQGHRQGLGRAGIVMEIIHPDHYVCVPASLEGAFEARVVGNLFFRRRRWVKDRQAAGRFLDYEDELSSSSLLEESDSAGAIARSRTLPSLTGSEPDDELVKIWDLVVRLDLQGQTPSGEERRGRRGEERLYRVLLAVDDPAVLSIEEYPYSRPMYFESAYVADEKNYWSGRSVSYNLQGLQETYNLLNSALYNAVMSEALPLVVGSGLPEKFTQYGFGDVIPDAEDMVSPPWAAPSRFGGGQALIYAMQQCERVGDQTARVSQNAMGAMVSRAITATEDNIIAAGVSSGQEEFIANFSSAFPAMAEATMELLEIHWHEWFPLFGVRPVIGPATGQPAFDPQTGNPLVVGMVELTPDDLRAPVLWEPAGKTPGHAPHAKLQAAQALMGAGMQVPGTGADPYELFRVMVSASNLNADGVQMSREHITQMQAQQMAAMQQQQALAALAGGHGTGASGGQDPAQGMAQPAGGPGASPMAGG